MRALSRHLPPGHSLLKQLPSIYTFCVTVKTDCENCPEITWGHLTLSDNRWGPSPMIDGVQDGEYAGQGSVWTAFDLRSPARGRMKKERHYTITKWSLAARHCLFIMGPRYGRWARSVNCLRWLRMVCVDFFGRYDVLLSCNSSCGWSSLIP